MKLLRVIILLLIAQHATAQNKFKGIWEGTLDVGVKLRIVFHLHTDTSGKWIAELDSPDQNAYGIVTDSMLVYNDSVYVGIKSIGGSFRGRLLNDTVIAGFFKQRMPLPLKLKKVDKVSKIIKPQTPVAPFPYETEDVVYSNKDKTLQYGATITYPSIPPGVNYVKAPTYPVAVLISGSGAQDRNEEIMNHQPFAVIADALTKRGFLVIRSDDRGVGKSTGDFKDATSMDFVNDIMATTDFIKKHVHADSFHIFLIGHSEGGMLAPMVANKRNDIFGIVSLAGIGIPVVDLMTEQNAAILKSSGMNASSVNEFAVFYKDLLKKMKKTTDTTEAYNTGMKAVNKWIKKINENVLIDLDMNNETNRKTFIRTLAQTFTNPWFHYFLNYDPKNTLKHLKNIHFLAMNGDRDVQVISTSNLAGMEKNLKKSKVKSYKIESLPGLNHLFQHCIKCTVSEYGELEETFSPDALKNIADWMLHVME